MDMNLNLAKGKNKIKIILNVLKNTFRGFDDNNITKLSGSLAYTIIFSLGPLLLVIISLCSIFLGRKAIEGEVYLQLAGFVGSDAASQFQDVVASASLANRNVVAMTVGIVTLIIGSTALFAEIQSSVNLIWGIRPQPKKGWLKFLQNRFLSFSILISLGFLLLITLGITTLIDGLSNRLMDQFPQVTVVFFYVLNLVITFIITSLVFGIIFKVLPDADIKWKHVRAGSFATATLFMIGKFIISYYIKSANVGNAYGAASSVIVLLTWVYFSAIILYFGAEFTKYYALHYGETIRPSKYAVGTKIIEIETEVIPVPENIKEELAKPEEKA